MTAADACMVGIVLAAAGVAAILAGCIGSLVLHVRWALHQRAMLARSRKTTAENAGKNRRFPQVVGQSRSGTSKTSEIPGVFHLSPMKKY